MRADISIDNPARVSATISITMTLEQWSELRKGIKDAPYYGPAQTLRQAIDELSEKMGEVFSFYDTPEEPEE